MTQETQTQPVDRGRRFRFVASLVATCLILVFVFTGAAALGWVVPTGAALVDLTVSSSFGLVTAVALTYLGGSVIDYNGGIGGILSTKTKAKG